MSITPPKISQRKVANRPCEVLYLHKQIGDYNLNHKNINAEKFENVNDEDQKETSNNNLLPNKTFVQKLDDFFKFSKRGSSVKQEFIGGFVNFLVLSYVLVVIPGLFGGVGGDGLWKALFLATS